MVFSPCDGPPLSAVLCDRELAAQLLQEIVAICGRLVTPKAVGTPAAIAAAPQKKLAMITYQYG
jgi:hypothetical protein